MLNDVKFATMADDVVDASLVRCKYKDNKLAPVRTLVVHVPTGETMVYIYFYKVANLHTPLSVLVLIHLILVTNEWIPGHIFPKSLRYHSQGC